MLIGGIWDDHVLFFHSGGKTSKEEIASCFVIFKASKHPSPMCHLDPFRSSCSSSTATPSQGCKQGTNMPMTPGAHKESKQRSGGTSLSDQAVCDCIADDFFTSTSRTPFKNWTISWFPWFLKMQQPSGKEGQTLCHHILTANNKINKPIACHGWGNKGSTS